jgi:hypothetical protein
MNKFYKTIAIIVVGCSLIIAAPVDCTIGARAYGFGGAYVAIVNEPSAAYWNPAALHKIDNISLMESNWIFQNVDGLNVNYASLAVPVPYVGTVSGSWLLKYAKLEEGSEAITKVASENLVSLSIGRMLWEKLLIFEKTSLGFSINRYTFTSSSTNGAGIGFDLGFWTAFPYGFSLGITGRNLGADMMGEQIEPELRFGLGYIVLIKNMHKISVAIDGLYYLNRDYLDEQKLTPAKNNLKAFGGLEYALCTGDWEIAVRGGVNKALYEIIKNYRYSAGCGIKWQAYSLQYAFIGDTESDYSLGYTHRIDLLVDIGKIIKIAIKK